MKCRKHLTRKPGCWNTVLVCFFYSFTKGTSGFLKKKKKWLREKIMDEFRAVARFHTIWAFGKGLEVYLNEMGNHCHHTICQELLSHEDRTLHFWGADNPILKIGIQSKYYYMWWSIMQRLFPGRNTEGHLPCQSKIYQSWGRSKGKRRNQSHLSSFLRALVANGPQQLY